MSALVLLHGWGMNAAVFDALREELPPDFETVTLALPGYAAGEDDEAPDFETAVGRIADEAPARCSVLGWSLGAQIALAWARSRPHQVERLVLVAATPCFVRREDWPCAMDARDFEGFEASLAREPRVALSRFTALQAQGDQDTRRTLARLRAALEVRALPPLKALTAGLRQLRDNDLRGGLAAIAQAALAIHGERDRLVPLAAARYLAGTLPRGRLAPIEGAAHAPFVSRPVEVARLVQAFLA